MPGLPGAGRVERDTPHAQTPEMKGEDTESAPALQQHYRAMVVWLVVNGRHLSAPVAIDFAAVTCCFIGVYRGDS